MIRKERIEEILDSHCVVYKQALVDELDSITEAELEQQTVDIEDMKQGFREIIEASKGNQMANAKCIEIAKRFIDSNET